MANIGGNNEYTAMQFQNQADQDGKIYSPANGEAVQKSSGSRTGRNFKMPSPLYLVLIGLLIVISIALSSAIVWQHLRQKQVQQELDKYEAKNRLASIVLSDKQVNTSALVTMIEQELLGVGNVSRSTDGQMIRFKPTGQCLENTLPRDSPTIPVTICNGEARQKWRMVIKNKFQLKVGIYQEEPTGNTGLCLDCYAGEIGCYVFIVPCYDTTYQDFFIGVHSRQIDLVQKQVYFSIYKTQYPSRCLTLRYSDYFKREIFVLDECTGADVQSFYLTYVDYSREIANILEQIPKS